MCLTSWAVLPTERGCRPITYWTGVQKSPSFRKGSQGSSPALRTDGRACGRTGDSRWPVFTVPRCPLSRFLGGLGGFALLGSALRTGGRAGGRASRGCPFSRFRGLPLPRFHGFPFSRCPVSRFRGFPFSRRPVSRISCPVPDESLVRASGRGPSPSRHHILQCSRLWLRRGESHAFWGRARSDGRSCGCPLPVARCRGCPFSPCPVCRFRGFPFSRRPFSRIRFSRFGPESTGRVLRTSRSYEPPDECSGRGTRDARLPVPRFRGFPFSKFRGVPFSPRVLWTRPPDESLVRVLRIGHACQQISQLNK